MNVKNVEIKTKGKLYNNYFIGLNKTQKNIMTIVLQLMEKDLNTITFLGDTLKEIMDKTGYTENTIRKNLSLLYPLIEPTKQSTREYIVNPMFAIRGDEAKIWKMYGSIERSRGNKEATILNKLEEDENE